MQQRDADDGLVVERTTRKLEMLTTTTPAAAATPSLQPRQPSSQQPSSSSPLAKRSASADVVHMNSRYVSNVTVGLRMKTKAPHHRHAPYAVPERSRTKSENSDKSDNSDNLHHSHHSHHLHNYHGHHHHQDHVTWMEHSSSYVSVLDPKLGNSFARRGGARTPLKRALSLEDIRAENLAASQPSHEMEFVSSRIQKLKVME